MSIKKHVPNLITLANLVLGCLSIVFAFSGRLFDAGVMILFAAFADFLDGSAARVLRAQSPIGKQLDSLADVISFGLAPAVIIFHLFEAANLQWDWLKYASLIIPVFSALRLARFNIDSEQSEFFRGLPVPANGILVASFPMIIHLEPSSSWITNLLIDQWFLLAYTIVFSLLLVSRIPLISLKFANSSWKENQLRFILVGCAILLMALFYIKAIPLIILLYFMVSGVDYLMQKY
ncbi:MAG: CDP-diacylglycerol--serine O-phosphatidyltransferase [Bacteroidales bacterium]|nr:CDP-diacylglycerol--serine O-phosphatidyltransferase [Bacteroidales bacterium]MCF8343976.1 CDP-diacylglycerol--serine O-phosphatidyltransferase [Bacteroidales bacterium]MCF8351107.1 CDP-diacylglycerol--serine O-phosphatidyltransferase [Bacteroidales bacterium]MCF8376958.1 CDP-diacylglycerol--serine O-phosphatidyltransferase [Bacteroidales bacterium]MCF8401300.1 CDP-diacylglycerol--serine O-phosphatidyltransferase [Bacteroidales bacterium]